ncbi:MAG: phosphatase PAP2 family protein [Gammaproteobacteria bacterium]
MLIWAGCLGLALTWDLSALDLPVMRLLGDAQGFAWRNEPLLRLVLHDGFRQVAWVLLLILAVWATRPGSNASPSRCERLAVLAGVLLSLLAINLIKLSSLTSCPWALADFGGTARYVSHWAWGMPDGGSGRCFPGGHASSALAFVGLCLPGLSRGQRSGWTWLTLVLVMGAIAGGAQTLRGAHYPSHTLWTLVICQGSVLTAWTAVMHRQGWRALA